MGEPLPYKGSDPRCRAIGHFGATLLLTVGLISANGLARADDSGRDPPPPPPAPGDALPPGLNSSPSVDEEDGPLTDPGVLRYQDCFQKMIDAGASDNAFMRRCLGLDAKPRKDPSGVELTLTNSDVQTALKAAEPDLVKCYDKALIAWKSLGQRPEGELSFAIVTKQATVQDVTFEQGIQDANLVTCFKSRLKKIVFRKVTDPDPEKISASFALGVNPATKSGGVTYVPAKLKMSGKGFGVSADDALAVFHRNAAMIRKCYDELTKRHPTAAGKVAVSLVVSPKGRVQRVFYREFTVAGAAFKSCVTAELKTWRFPRSRSGEPSPVDYPPFEFRPK